MHTNNLFVNDGSDGQTVEAIRKSLPEFDVVTTLAFIVKSIDTVDARTFMVATEDEKVFRVLDLISQQQANGLQRLLATIDIVTEEEVI